MKISSSLIAVLLQLEIRDRRIHAKLRRPNLCTSPIGVTEALDAITEAEAWIDRSEERWWYADLAAPIVMLPH